MEDFMSIMNFKKIYEYLNSYSKKNYSEPLEFKRYKEIIGNTMSEIFREYNKKVDKKRANQMVTYISKKIIDKNMKNKFFEEEYTSNLINDLTNLRPVVDNGIRPDEDLKIRPVFEKRYDRIFEDTTTNQIDNSFIIKKDIDTDIKDFFIYKKDEETPIDLTKGPEQLREELIIAPDDYIKTLQKQIKYEDVIIDSRDRNITIDEDPSKYTINLERDISNIISIELISAEIPNVEYITNENNNLIHFKEATSTLVATIPIGNYTLSTLVTAIQTQMIAVGGSTYTVAINDFQRVTETFTADTPRVTSTAGEPWKIFNADIDTEWFSSSLPASFIYDFGTDTVINKYRFICSETTGRPSDWVLEVSNNKVNWATIDTKTSESTTQFVYATYTLASNALAGRYVRFSISDSSNSTNVHISELEFFRSVTDRISITSDLTGGTGLFELLFEGNTVDTGHLSSGTKTLFKKNSIGELIGFNPENLTGFSSYSSEKEVILDRERKVFLYVNGLGNIDVVDEHESDRFIQLTLESNKGEYSFFKNREDWTESHLNEFIFFSQTPMNMKQLKIQFRKYNGDFYKFYGVNHSLHFRFKFFNFKNQVIGDINHLLNH